MRGVRDRSSSCRTVYWIAVLLWCCLFGGYGAESVMAQSEAAAVEIKNPAAAKLSTQLLRIQDDPSHIGRLQSDLVQTAGDTILVYIALMPGYGAQAVVPLVAKVEDCDPAVGLLAAWVRPSQLSALAAAAAVRSVRPVEAPLVRRGVATSQGDVVLRAQEVRERLGCDGSGVKIGVISDGVDHLAAAQASGDLPADMVVLSNRRGGDEGTAMLEIIHDLAPGAQLYFHDCGSNVIAFKRAFDNLHEAGCSIICDDIGWIAEPYFEDGVVAQHLAKLAAQPDLLLISSAGNEGRSHYQGIFRPVGGSGSTSIHDFSGGSGDPRLRFKLLPGERLRVVLQWDDRFGASANDYDLVLRTAWGDLLDSSRNQQSGGGNPLEVIDWSNLWFTDPVEVALEVENDGGTVVAKTLELFIFEGIRSCLSTAYLTSPDSLFGHPTVPGVLAVGTAFVGTPAEIAPYSSQGPVTIAFPQPERRLKPDLIGVDGVTVTGAGGFSNPFFGTSAAAPHVAAVAALVWSKAPDLSANEVSAQLRQGCLDLGEVGADAVYGAGRVDALRSVESISPGESFLAVALSRDTAPVGEVVQVIAQAGGMTQPQYQFWVQLPQDERWSVLTDYRSENRLNFTQTVPGNYRVLVYAKSAAAPYSAAIVSQPLTVSFTGKGVNALELKGPNGLHPERQEAVFTAQAEAEGGKPLYQYWQHDDGGWKQLGAYSDRNTLTIPGLPAGSYVIAACALEEGDLQAGKWAAVFSRSCLLNVGSQVQLTVPASAQLGATVKATAAAFGITGCEYQFWYQSSDRVWRQSGAYTGSDRFAFSADQTGTYTVVVYAKDHYAPATEQFAVRAVRTMNVG